MKVGIGITTTPNRHHLLHKAVNQIQTYTNDADIYIHNDEKFKGVAYSKNMCIKHLNHCDFVFLFDDDCFPTNPNWVKYCTSVFNETQEAHFLLLNKVIHAPYYQYALGMYYFDNCGGVFMAFDNRKGLFKKVGYMDTRYKGWGFEHAGYSNRIHKMGFTTHAYIMPQYLHEYIYSMDYSGGVQSSISNEEKQSNYYDNYQVFLSELNDKPKYKPFKQ